MVLDFAGILPTVLVAIIGFLIRQSFKSFAEKLDTVVEKVERLDERQDEVEKRTSVVHAILQREGLL